MNAEFSINFDRVIRSLLIHHENSTTLPMPGENVGSLKMEVCGKVSEIKLYFCLYTVISGVGRIGIPIASEWQERFVEHYYTIKVQRVCMGRWSPSQT